MFTRLEENLADKLHSVIIAEEKLNSRHQNTDVISWINSNVIGEEFVLFCGAGISIPGSSSAPGFLELRNNLVIAIIQNLLKRGVISVEVERRVVKAIEQLRVNKLTFPPEMVFSSVRQSLGDEVLANVLACLNQGMPNENHIGIRLLAEQPSSRLFGVITPNFDSYIEKAFEGMPHTVYLPDNSEGDMGFPIVKPHGSFNKMSTIIVTLEELHTPLRQSMRERIKRLISNRIVLVIGYSGMDFDLFPLLVHAGKYWNTRIVWILYQDDLNTQVRKIQLALGNNCIVLDGKQSNVLAELNDLRMSTKLATDRNIVPQFTEAMKNCSTEDLIYAFIELLGPIGVPNDSKIFRSVLEAQLNQLCKYGYDFDSHRLNLILQITKYPESKKLRKSAAQLGKKIALASHNDKWLKQFEYYETVESLEDEDPDTELKDIEFSLSSDFFPYLEEYEDTKKAGLMRYFTLDRLRRKAELLWEMEEYHEAERIVRGLLTDYHFPETGISGDAVWFDEAAEEGKLRYILARILIERDEKEEAERELCRSLDILWRELDTWELDLALDVVHADFTGRGISNHCIATALTVAVKVARLTDNFIEELENLVTKLESGFGDEQDLERTKFLLIQVKETTHWGILDYKDLEDRMKVAEKMWFRDGHAVFLKRMGAD